MAREYLCNMCGKKLDEYDIDEKFSLDRRLGYGSRNDGGMLELDLCCDCMDDLISKCKINPVVW